MNNGTFAQTGPVQFVVGTGGKSVQTTTIALSNTATIVDDMFGVLLLELSDGGYSWKFRSTDDSIPDMGSTTCH